MLNCKAEKNKVMYQNLLKKKVLVRSDEAGVYFGTLEKVEGSTVRLSSVRNIWSWKGATCLSQVASEGVSGGRVSQTVASMILLGVCQILPLTEAAIRNLENQPIWKV